MLLYLVGPPFPHPSTTPRARRSGRGRGLVGQAFHAVEHMCRTAFHTLEEARMTQSRYELSALTAAGLAVAASLLLVVPAAAQTGTITGSALSAATGERLDAALVSLVGSDLQALTQINGRFVLVNVPAGEHTLQVDLIGFTTTTEAVTVTAGAVSAINVRMKIEAIVLGRLVVTGVQGAMSRLKVPFEVAQVNVGDLPLPPMTAAQAIQGKVAGAQVFSGSGRPGSAPSILLRRRDQH